MVVLADDSMLEQITENLSMLRGIGIDEREINPVQAREHFPELDFDKVEKIVYEPESGYADPTAVANSYSHAAASKGCEIMLNEEVERLIVSGEKIKSIELKSGRAIPCSAVVLCTNVWTNKLLARSGVEKTLPIRAVPHPVLIYRRPGDYQGTRTIVVDGPNKNYYKPEGNSLLSGGSLDSKLDENGIEPENSPQEIPFEYLEDFSVRISKRVRPMANGTFLRGYYGLYDISPDEHPIIDELSGFGLKGVYCCVGLSGHGFKLSPALGLMVSDMILSNPNPMFDWLTFSLDRFQSGRTIRKKYAGIGTIA
jgi:sarcosine oxidase, subunit beta